MKANGYWLLPNRTSPESSLVRCGQGYVSIGPLARSASALWQKLRRMPGEIRKRRQKCSQATATAISSYSQQGVQIFSCAAMESLRASYPPWQTRHSTVTIMSGSGCFTWIYPHRILRSTIHLAGKAGKGIFCNPYTDHGPSEHAVDQR